MRVVVPLKQTIAGFHQQIKNYPTYTKLPNMNRLQPFFSHSLLLFRRTDSAFFVTISSSISVGPNAIHAVSSSYNNDNNNNNYAAGTYSVCSMV